MSAVEMTSEEEIVAIDRFLRNMVRDMFKLAIQSRNTVSIDIPDDAGLSRVEIWCIARAYWPQAVVVQIRDPYHPFRVFRDSASARLYILEKGGRVAN